MLSWKIISVKILLWRNLQVGPASLAIIIRWFHMITWDIVMVSLLRITKRTRDSSIWVGEKKCNYQINSHQSGLKNKGITCCLNYFFWILSLLSQVSSTTEKLREGTIVHKKDCNFKKLLFDLFAYFSFSII